jgi:hypothetical protein
MERIRDRKGTAENIFASVGTGKPDLTIDSEMIEWILED